MKRIRLSKHAEEQANERGATRPEMEEAVRKGSREPTIRGREICRYNFAFRRKWQGKYYAIKLATGRVRPTGGQVAPVINEEANEIIVITVYTFYF